MYQTRTFYRSNYQQSRHDCDRRQQAPPTDMRYEVRSNYLNTLNNNDQTEKTQQTESIIRARHEQTKLSPPEVSVPELAIERPLLSACVKPPSAASNSRQSQPLIPNSQQPEIATRVGTPEVQKLAEKVDVKSLSQTASTKQPGGASNSGTTKPQVRKDQSRAQLKKTNNVFSLLKDSDSSSEEDSEEESEEGSEEESKEFDEKEANFEESRSHDRTKKAVNASVEDSKAPGDLLHYETRADCVPGTIRDDPSDKLTKAEKKKLKKERQKEKQKERQKEKVDMVKEKITTEAEKTKEKQNVSKYVQPMKDVSIEETEVPGKDKKLNSKEEAVGHKNIEALAVVPGINGDNISDKMAKEEKKRLKKQRQKEKAAVQNEDKFFDYVSSVKKEIYLRNFAKAKTLIFEAFKLSTQKDQSRVLYELRYKMFQIEEKYDLALRDLKKLIETDSTDREHLRSALDCCLKTGNVKDFKVVTKTCRDCKFDFLETAKQKMSQFERFLAVAKEKEKEELYTEAANALTQSLRVAPNCLKIYYWLAKVQALDMKTTEARQTLKQIVKITDKIQTFPVSEAHINFILGLCSFYDGEMRSAETRFRLAKREVKAAEQWFYKTWEMRTKEEKVEELIEYRMYSPALEVLQKALELGEGNKKHTVKMHEKKANIFYLMKNFEASRDCLNKAIDIDPRAHKCLFYRGKMHLELGEHDSAVRDFTSAFRLYPCPEYESQLSRAEKLLKKSFEQGETNYYQILGVDRSADIQTIKKAFRKKALEFHPDKHAHSTREVQLEMERKMKELSQAYSCLSDDQKKRMYDAVSEDSDDEDDDLVDILVSQFFESMMGGGSYFFFRHQGQRSRRRR